MGEAAVRGIRITLGERVSGWVAANRQTITNSDPTLDLVEIAHTVSPRLRASLATPLTAEQNLVGVLALYSDVANVFTEDHRRIVEILAKQIAQFVVKAAERETRRREVLTDTATGLPNTEYLKRLFASDGRFAGESLHPLTLLLIDVGPTGATREVYGAGVADQVMAHAAIAIRRSLRGADILFRYDDDEFVVLLARTDADLADQVARRIVEAAANLKLVVSPDEEISIAIRVGGATAPGDGRSLVSLVETARQRRDLWSSTGTTLPFGGLSIH